MPNINRRDFFRYSSATVVSAVFIAPWTAAAQSIPSTDTTSSKSDSDKPKRADSNADRPLPSGSGPFHVDKALPVRVLGNKPDEHRIKSATGKKNAPSLQDEGSTNKDKALGKNNPTHEGLEQPLIVPFDPLRLHPPKASLGGLEGLKTLDEFSNTVGVVELVHAGYKMWNEPTDENVKTYFPKAFAGLVGFGVGETVIGGSILMGATAGAPLAFAVMGGAIIGGAAAVAAENQTGPIVEEHASEMSRRISNAKSEYAVKKEVLFLFTKVLLEDALRRLSDK
jgi:hypothetical protein